jgi:hypothetical protein
MRAGYDTGVVGAAWPQDRVEVEVFAVFIAQTSTSTRS